MPRAPHSLHAVVSVRALLLGACLALLAVAHALAAGPSMPAGVASDGSLTVVLVDWLRRVPQPVAGATVEVVAVRDGVVLGSVSAVTGSGGIAELRELPRATSGSPIELHVAAGRRVDSVDADGCVVSESVTGVPAVVRSAAAATIELEVARASSMICAPTSADTAAARPPAAAATPADEAERTGAAGVPPGVPVLLVAIGSALVAVARILRPST